MKIAHLADVHLGCRQYYRQTPDGRNQREFDVATVFARAIDDIIAANVDVVIIAGDLFHSVRPSNPAILQAFNQLAKLRTNLPDAPVFLIAGNHDSARSAETGTILKLFEELDGVAAVTQAKREFPLEEFDTSIVCVPHAALLADSATSLDPPAKPSKHNVLVLHGEVAGVLPKGSNTLEYGGVVVDPNQLKREHWSYVALGHYHVARAAAPNAWYSGSLDYVSTNPWGELVDEAELGRRGKKGWLYVDIQEETQVEFRPVALERRIIDLEPIKGNGLSAKELDRLIADRLSNIPDGIRDDIVRQVVLDVPRPLVRELDHQQIRDAKAKSLHYNLDIRPPTSRRAVGVGSPGRSQTLVELAKDFLERRPLAATVDRKQLIELGLRYMDEVERDLLED